MNDALINAFGAVMQGQKPSEVSADTIITVERFNDDALSFKVGDFAGAYRNVTYRTEHRAHQDLQAMAERIQQARIKVLSYIDAVPANAEELRQAFDSFVAKHVEFSTDLIRSNNNRASAAVTGPSNFPTARQQKQTEAYFRRYDNLLEHVEKNFKTFKRVAYPHGDPAEAIRSNNPNALGELAKKLAHLKAYQQTMKDKNALVRKAVKMADPLAFLLENGFSEAFAKDSLNPPYGNPRAYSSFELTNNNAKIKQAEKRVKELTALANTETSETAFDTEAGTIRVVENTELVRIQLFFDGKPAAEIRDKVKRAGFKWARTQGAWQRHLNNNGRYSTNRLLKELGAETGAAL